MGWLIDQPVGPIIRNLVVITCHIRHGLGARLTRCEQTRFQLTKRHILALLEVIRLVRDFQIDRSLGWEARDALDELLLAP